MAPPTFQPAIRQITQFGVEVTPGTLVPATKRFNSITFDRDPKKPSTGVRQAGNMYEVNRAPGKGHTEFGIKSEGVAVSDLTYLLATQIVEPSFTSSGSSARLALFAPDSFATNPRKVFSLEKGGPGSGNAKTSAYCQAMDLDLSFTPEKPVGLTGKIWGRTGPSGQTLTSPVTTLDASTLFGLSIDVYIATTEAGLPSGLVYPFSCNLKLNKFVGDVYVLNSANQSFEALIEVMPTVEYDFVFPDDATSEAFVDSIDLGSLYYVEIIARGGLIETGIHNQFRARSPIRFSDPSESDTQDAHAVGVKAIAQHDPTFNSAAGGALLIECQSTVSSIA